MSVYYQNTRGLRTKCNEFYLNLLNNNYDLVCLTETWLNDSINSSEFFSHNYTVFRRDRETSASTKKMGGGCLIAINSNFISSCIRKSNWETDVEDLWISFSARNTRINVCCVCLPNDLDLDILERFYDKLQSIFSANSNDKFLIIGDFNLADYIKQINDREIVSSIKKVNFLISTMNLGGLSQFNSIRNSHNGILDLVLSNFNINVSNGLDESIVSADNYHPPLLIDLLNFHQRTNVANSSYLNFYSANYEIINEKINAIDWISILNVEDVNICLSIFYDSIKQIIDDCVPLKVKHVSRFPSWYKGNTIRVYKLKLKLHKRWKNSGNSHDFDLYSRTRAHFKSLVRQDFLNYIQFVEQNVCNNVSYFWKYVKYKRGTNSPSVPPSVRFNGSQSCNYMECVNLFADYFQSVYTNAHITANPIIVDDGTSIDLGLNSLIIQSKLEGLDCSKSSGADNIPPIFLKKTSSSISIPVSIIFNKSLRVGIFPDTWKSTFVSPILKKGDTTDVKNYRPISKLSSLAKLFESIITDYLYDKLITTIIPQQHGFVKGRSTTSNLLCFSEYVIKAVDKKIQVDTVYTDLEKAFDKVDHNLLIGKLQNLGIEGNLLAWLKSYLTGRSLKVVLNGVASSGYTPTSGVPQGSHIGPLLFLVYINDIQMVIRHSEILLFADDLKIFKQICSIDDANNFQLDLDAVCNFFQSIYIPINFSKCVCMRFTRNIINRFDIFYSLNSNTLSFSNNYDDLGVIFDTKLSFKPHFGKIVTKGFRMLGFLFRSTSHFSTVKPYLLLYNTLVRSQLEYCVQIWNPNYANHSDYIERVQKRFLMFIFRKNLLPHGPTSYSHSWTRRKLDLLSLKNRRTYLELVFLYKSIHGLNDSSSYIGGYNFYSVRSNTRNRNTFYYGSVRSNLGANSPLQRIMRLYNREFDREFLLSNNFAAFKHYISGKLME